MNIKALLTIAAALSMSGAARADYVVILKDGSAIMTEERFRVEKGLAILRTSDGRLVSVATEHVDARRTEEANAPDAVVVDRSAWLKKSQEESLQTPSQSPREEDTAPTVARTVDNYELRKYRNIRINAGEGPVPERVEEGKEAEEEKASKTYNKSDLIEREEELRKMVDAINAKVEEANSRTGNFTLQKRTEREVEEMRKTYQKEWQGYAGMVKQYNTQQYGGARPSSSTEETTPGAGGEAEEE